MTRSFSIEIKSKNHLDKISINDDNLGVLIEGEYGEFCNLFLHEDKLLEIIGSNGIFRIEVTREELSKILSPEDLPQE